MTQKHKNAEWVKIFVEGKPVQWKMAGIEVDEELCK